MKEIVKNKLSKKKISILLELTFLFLPFGSYVLSFSIGFMTIYPSLVLISILTLLGFFLFKKEEFNKTERYTLIFLASWIIYAIIYLPFINGIGNAIIDIRALILMFMYTFSFFWTYKYLGLEKWKKIILSGVKLYFFLLLIFAFFEIQTGIHFQGFFTDKLLNLDPSLTHYAPVYIYDNPNNFVCIFILLGILLLSLNKSYRTNHYALAFITVAIYFISNISDARIGKVIAIILILYTSIIIVKAKFKIKKHFLVHLTIIISLFLVFGQEKYYGPIWQTIKHKNTSQTVVANTSLNSIQVRTNLYYNSIEALKSSNYLGIGPGQFRQYSIEKKFKLNTETNISPHSWLFEIYSQYGILIFGGYLYIFVLILLYFKNNFRKHTNQIIFLIIALTCFGLSSFLPSSFLSMEINWIFLSIIVIVSTNLETYGEQS